MHDFDFFFGRWSVQHRRLVDRLVGDTRWEIFGGTCEVWPTLGGFGNIDDNVLDLPAGQYRAMTIRKFDPESGKWSIWWLDGRSEGIEPPVHGAFKQGVGIFVGDDLFKGKPIKVRFEWSETASSNPRWRQAFSGDGGATWEVNWEMTFSRRG